MTPRSILLRRRDAASLRGISNWAGDEINIVFESSEGGVEGHASPSKSSGVFEGIGSVQGSLSGYREGPQAVAGIKPGPSEPAPNLLPLVILSLFTWLPFGILLYCLARWL